MRPHCKACAASGESMQNLGYEINALVHIVLSFRTRQETDGRRQKKKNTPWRCHVIVWRRRRCFVVFLTLIRGKNERSVGAAPASICLFFFNKERKGNMWRKKRDSVPILFHQWAKKLVPAFTLAFFFYSSLLTFCFLVFFCKFFQLYEWIG